MRVKGQKTPLSGIVTVPGDKSISHRAVIMGALAKGETVINGFLPGEDCLCTVECFKQLGVNIKCNGQKVTIEGVGLHGLKPSQRPLDAGNSGTTMRIMSGVLAAQDFLSVIDGDNSLRKRPMKRIIQPLRSMGALVFSESGEKAPLIFQPPENGKLKGLRHELPVASAQVKSALLLAGLYSEEPVTVKEPALSRDHTERMLKAFGVDVGYNDDKSITLPVGQTLHGCKINVPGDISSAAFILVAAAVCPGSNVTITNVGLNYTRAGIVEVLQDMGADLTILTNGEGEEPVGDITIKYTPLKCTNIIKGEIIPRLIDEIPAIAILAATAQGTTVIKDAEELRVKESDRIDLILKMLEAFGVQAKETPDGMEINGGQKFVIGKNVQIAKDHRMAMAATLAALLAEGETVFDEENCIDVSFPGFAETLAKIGAEVEEGGGIC